MLVQHKLAKADHGVLINLGGKDNKNKKQQTQLQWEKKKKE